MTLRGLHHFALKARDPSALAAFYRDVLGLPEKAVHRDERGVRSVWLSAGDTILMIERSEQASESTKASHFFDDPPGLHLFAFAISSEARGAWRERLERHGARVEHQTAYTLYARDPESNRFGLSSWPEAGHDASSSE